MSMYNRAALEAELDQLDELDQYISVMVANGQRDGRWAVKAGQVIEQRRKRAHARLYKTRWRLGDILAAQRNLASAISMDNSIKIRAAKKRLGITMWLASLNNGGILPAEALEIEQHDCTDAERVHMRRMQTDHEYVLRWLNARRRGETFDIEYEAGR